MAVKIINSTSFKMRDEKLINSISNLKKDLDRKTEGNKSKRLRIAVRENEDLAFGSLDFYFLNDKRTKERCKQFFQF